MTVGLSGTLKSPVENPEPGHGGILPQHRSCCIGNKIQDAHPIQDRWERVKCPLWADGEGCVCVSVCVCVCVCVCVSVSVCVWGVGGGGV